MPYFLNALTDSPFGGEEESVFLRVQIKVLSRNPKETRSLENAMAKHQREGRGCETLLSRSIDALSL